MLIGFLLLNTVKQLINLLWSLYKDVEFGQKKDIFPDCVKNSMDDENKQQSELNSGVNSHNSTDKLAKKHSHNGGDAKDDRNHLRAKRGQATNSHSLAERVSFDIMYSFRCH